MKYRSQKSVMFILIMVFLLIMIIVSFDSKIYIMVALLALVASYFVWMWFDTYYKITANQLIYKCALIQGSIEIATISEIAKSRKMFSGIKASLSNKGLVIKFNKWDEVYISPENPEQFISALKASNLNIKIT